MNLIIGKPYIEKLADGKARLCSAITKGDDKRVLYYEVDEEYGQYLNDDRCDCFVVGLLNSCMYNRENIITEAPVSKQLLFQLRVYYIPVIADLFSDMSAISIETETIDKDVNNIGAIGTGNSGGVDSTYTMLKYSRDVMDAYKLTHAIFTNISTNDTDDERIRTLFERDISLKKEAAENLGLKFISCYTNLYSFYKHPGIFNHYFAQQYCSVPLALGKLFKVYYFSSTFKVCDFSMDESFIVSSGRYDIYSLDTLSTNSLKFYSAGTEVDRMDKMNYIIDSDYAKTYLQVCSIEQSAGSMSKIEKLNCGYCSKCGRMIGLFYARGILDDFSSIFDLSYFYTNKAKFIGRNVEADQGAFAKKVISELKKNGKYPAGTDFYRFYYHVRYRLARNRKFVKMYHKLRKFEE